LVAALASLGLCIEFCFLKLADTLLEFASNSDWIIIFVNQKRLTDAHGYLTRSSEILPALFEREEAIDPYRYHRHTELSD
jgi:hypothetical protein